MNNVPLLDQIVVSADVVSALMEAMRPADPTLMIEQLANVMHSQWSGWTKHMFKFGEQLPDGRFVMDACKVERWMRQMETPYSELPEDEKQSDRIEAQKVVDLLLSFRKGA